MYQIERKGYQYINYSLNFQTNREVWSVREVVQEFILVSGTNGDHFVVAQCDEFVVIRFNVILRNNK